MMWPLTQMMKTRTRTSGREASRRARRPQLESLEDRTVLSVTFAAYSSGTWAYNSANSSWREISTAIPKAMDEGAVARSSRATLPGPGVRLWQQSLDRVDDSDDQHSERRDKQHFLRQLQRDLGIQRELARIDHGQRDRAGRRLEQQRVRQL